MLLFSAKATIAFPKSAGLLVFLVYEKYIKHKEECFIRYLNTEKWVEKTRRSRFFYTNFEVFDIASQGIDNSWRISQQNFTEFYDN